ncbi:unnamed protein product [Ciceribacter selenitireducens ATCC BAA-1503]|uniref:Uncharacterized protein n=1 Tax=Ciceribacter selenitireducens ATCC BAA-1503 TaxID=1336235 RepID=A0A376AGV9_9HYPH|nr:unnamed protein product [Ciceribacter selenitireducens ATCC BAA-1503]
MDLERAGFSGGAGRHVEEEDGTDEETCEDRQGRPGEGPCIRSRMTAPVSAERRAAIMRYQQFNPRPKDYVPRQPK